MAKFDYRQADVPAPAPATLSGRWRLFLRERPAMPYVIPFFAFLLVMVPGQFQNVAGIDWNALWRQYFPMLYPLKTVIAALLLWYFWPWYTRVRWNKLWLGAIAGIVGTGLWIGTWMLTDILAQKLGTTVRPSDADIYNPDKLGGGWQESLFLCLRIAGPTLVVPFMEELFFRDFLTRTFIAGSRFEDVPVGKFTWLSFLTTAALFGINHGFDFFLPGVVYGVLMGVLLIRTKSLGACIVAHGVTNLTLYLYVVYSGDWKFM